MSTATSQETCERLLDAAERLFGEHGIDAASLRDITREAGVNVAAVNYHFGSKEALLPAICERRFTPLNAERIRMLDLAESAAGESPPTVESIVQAFVGPTVRVCREHPDFMRLLGHIHHQPELMHEVVLKQCRFDDVVSRFRSAVIRAFPDSKIVDLWWGMNFMIGALVHTWMHLKNVEVLSKGEAVYDSDEAMIGRLVTFATAGLRALAVRESA
ncbi:MAG: TetR/AcrR family transcriptional regulator [Planctomycetota bacterium]|jgi:AcrR family transcriptional regulator